MFDDIEINDDTSFFDNASEEFDSSESQQNSYINDDYNCLDSSVSVSDLDYNGINSAESFLHCYGGTLTIDDVNTSIHDASVFFNMESPMIVSEGWTTGVFNGDLTTVNDDVLIFNPEQLQSMGITEKDGLDLVMTHENTHRALQGVNSGFSDHQEELCCDYMAGVRAGLNSIDTQQMVGSLIDTSETLTHPAGTIRVKAIQEGREFAENYQRENGHSPTFEDCLEHFRSSDAFQLTDNPLAIIQNPTAEGVSITNLTNHPDEDLHGFINDKEWNLKEAHAAQKNAEYHEKRTNAAIARGDLSAAKDHESSAARYRKQEQEHIKSAQKSTK